jgi:serine/threonine protein kinase
LYEIDESLTEIHLILESVEKATPLLDFIRKKSHNYTELDVAKLSRQLLRILHLFKKKQILHRDINPSKFVVRYFIYLES